MDTKQKNLIKNIAGGVGVFGRFGDVWSQITQIDD